MLHVNLQSAPQRFVEERLFEEDERPFLGLLSLSTAALLSVSLWAAAATPDPLVSAEEATERVVMLDVPTPGASEPAPTFVAEEYCAIGHGGRRFEMTANAGFSPSFSTSLADRSEGIDRCRRHVRGCPGSVLPVTLAVEVRSGRLHNAWNTSARSALSRCLALDMLRWQDLPEGHHEVTFSLSPRRPSGSTIAVALIGSGG